MNILQAIAFSGCLAWTLVTLSYILFGGKK